MVFIPFTRVCSEVGGDGDGEPDLATEDGKAVWEGLCRAEGISSGVAAEGSG